ncbi:hypothetical protein SOVF_183040 [Spinacia oleracea]|nr:hypothetical protein SOVF_183040 [Spinacia oleracea]
MVGEASVTYETSNNLVPNRNFGICFTPPLRNERAKRFPRETN